MSDAPHPEPAAVCETCGRPEATRFADETLCVDCYAERGACCAGEANSDCSLPGASAGASPKPRP